MVPRRHYAAAAGRKSARRFLFVCAVLVGSIGLTGAASNESQVSVSESDGLYRVVASFAIAQPPHAAIAVLTDFERIPEYVPDMKISTVREHTDAGTIVEQEAIAKFMMFSKRVHLVLFVSETAGRITFRDECRRSFAVYEGSWVVKPAGTGSTIEYRLAAKPTFDVPAFVLKRLLKRDAADLIERLKTEIASRGSASR